MRIPDNNKPTASTTPEPDSKDSNRVEIAEGTNRIQGGQASQSTALRDRSGMPVVEITADELAQLIKNQTFSNDCCYKCNGNLDLRRCTSLTHLPDNLTVNGYLDLDSCTSLTHLPDHLTVKGYLDLDSCTSLTHLPDNLTVEGYLRLDGCTSLTHLPDNLTVGSFLGLYSCTSLTHLPDNLTVNGTLDLDSCTSLTHLPDNLTVERLLNLYDCTGLTHLPDSLIVNGNLILRNCTSLTHLPNNPAIGCHIDLSDCTSLTSLPDWITELGPISENEMRHVNLANTGLSDTIINGLSTANAPGMQFYFSMRERHLGQRFSNTAQAFAFWKKLAPPDTEIPELDLRSDQAAALVDFMGRLTETEDYQNKTSRPLLAQRVMNMMALLTDKSRYREEALTRIGDAVSSCDDRVILTLDDLETLQVLDSAKTKAIENNDPDELRALGLQMMRLDKLKEIARDHMKTLKWVDEIEVELAFQIGVRKQLDLPGSTQNMIFIVCAKVSNQDIAKAVEQIKDHCSDTQRVATYFAEWEPWKMYQRKQAIPAFEQLTSKTVDSIGDCFIRGETTNKMVELNGTHVDYDALCKAYLEKGNNPLTNTPVDWSTVFRVT